MNSFPFSRVFGVLLLALLTIHQPAWPQEDEEEWEEAEEARIDLLHSIAEAHFEKAFLLQETDRTDQAIEELKKILTLPFPEGEEIEERLFEVNIAMAELYLESERFAEGEKLLRETLRRFDGQPRRLADIHILMGRMLSEQGKRGEALEHLTRAIELGRQVLEDSE